MELDLLNKNSNLTSDLEKSNFSNFNNLAKRPKIKIFGLGNAGCNVVNKLLSSNEQIKQYITAYCLDTNPETLNKIDKVDNKRLLEFDFNQDSNLDLSTKLSQKEQDILKQEIKDTDLLISISGLGKITGSIMSLQLAKLANEMNIPNISLVNIPSLKLDGDDVYSNAMCVCQELRNYTNSICTVSVDEVLKEQNLPLFETFNRCDKMLIDVVNNIINLVYKTDLMKINFNVLTNFFKENNNFKFENIELNIPHLNQENIVVLFKNYFSSKNIKVNALKNKKIIINFILNKAAPSSLIDDVKNGLFEYLGTKINVIFSITYKEIENNILSILVPTNNCFESEGNERFEIEKEMNEQEWDFDKINNIAEYKDLINDVKKSSKSTEDILKEIKG